MENWKVIKGFEAYEVSDLGRIRRIGKATGAKVGRVLKPWTDSGGYPTVYLSVGNKRSAKNIHRVVAEAFIPNPQNLPEVNHLDLKTNNKIDKLEWSSIKNNFLHAVKTGRTPGDGISIVKKTGKYVARYNPVPYTKKHIGTFETFEEAKAARDAKVATL